jgi:hypothetical protein
LLFFVSQSGAPTDENKKLIHPSPSNDLAFRSTHREQDCRAVVDAGSVSYAMEIGQTRKTSRPIFTFPSFQSLRVDIPQLAALNQLITHRPSFPHGVTPPNES